MFGRDIIANNMLICDNSKIFFVKMHLAIPAGFEFTTDP